MKIYKIEDILGKLEYSIKKKRSFSHIRFGDGGIKLLHAVFHSDKNQLEKISIREGIPVKKMDEIVKFWGYCARKADFIDTPAVYFTDKFWDRTVGPGQPISVKTEKRLKMWKELYSEANFENQNYCNPESNYLMVSRIKGKKNLLDIMGDKKIAIICTNPEIRNKLTFCKVTAIKIAGHFENQYTRSFDKITAYIKKNARRFDFWLVAAGELGRVYSGLIKANGGRSIDIGFIVDFWMGADIHPRLKPYLTRKFKSNFELELTFLGQKYEEYL